MTSLTQPSHWLPMPPEHAQAFCCHPVWQGLPIDEIARLAGQTRWRMVQAGEPLYTRHSPAAQVFLLQDGTWQLTQDGSTQQRTEGFLGAERTLGAEHYRGEAQAMCDGQLYALPATVLAQLASRHPALLKQLFHACIAPGLPPSPPASPAPADSGQALRLLGWLCTGILPLLIVALAPDTLPDKAITLLAILTATACMWVFHLTSPVTPPLFALSCAILLDVASPGVMTAGFASEGFFMLLSVLLVGALMRASGLSERLSLWLLIRLPNHPRWHALSLLTYALALTPIIPSQLARASLSAPFLHMLHRLYADVGLHSMHPRLFASAIAGVSLGASIFLTGKPANLLVFGLFDQQTQYAFEWLPWFMASASAGAVLLLCHGLASAWVFSAAPAKAISVQSLRVQLGILGKMRPGEWWALAAVMLVVLGMLTSHWHKIDIPWLLLGVSVIMLLCGALSAEDINRRVDWSVLVFIAAIVAWAPMMKASGLEAQIASAFAPVAALMKSSLPGFLAALSLVVLVLRLVLPELVAEILLLAVLLPLAQGSGVSQWLVGFAVLTLCEGYFLPYQAPYHLMLSQSLDDADQRHGRALLTYNAIMMMARILALFASLPVWHAMGLM